MQVATPLGCNADEQRAADALLLLAVKATLPARGTPPVLMVTVALNVTGWSTAAGLGDAVTDLVDVGSAVMICVTADDAALAE